MKKQGKRSVTEFISFSHKKTYKIGSENNGKLEESCEERRFSYSKPKSLIRLSLEIYSLILKLVDNLTRLKHTHSVCVCVCVSVHSEICPKPARDGTTITTA